MKEAYIVIKELPDAVVGTEVIWDEDEKLYSYEKNEPTHKGDRTYLTETQVIKSDYFCIAEKYPEYYGYYYKVLSRKDVLSIIEKIDMPSTRVYEFERELRVLANLNANFIIKQNEKQKLKKKV